MAFADSPPGNPGGVSPGKSALRPDPVKSRGDHGVVLRDDRRIYLRDQTVWLCCVVPARLVASALVCGSCSSARRFPVAFLPPVGYPRGVGFGLSLFHVSMNGHPTGDLHPICNAPMLGAHKITGANHGQAGTVCVNAFVCPRLLVAAQFRRSP